MTTWTRNVLLAAALGAFLSVVLLTLAVYDSQLRIAATTYQGELAGETETQVITSTNRPPYRPCPRPPFEGEAQSEPCPTTETVNPEPAEPTTTTAAPPVATPTGTVSPLPPPPPVVTTSPPLSTNNPPTTNHAPTIDVPSEITVTVGDVKGTTILAHDQDGQPIQLRILYAEAPDARNFCTLEGTSEVCFTPECRKPQ